MFFFNVNPHLINRVIFTGPIFDKKELWSYYNKAKIFLLTSRSEGFATVYAEAYRFSNYILSTDVGGARDIMRWNNNYGEIINESSATLKNKMQDIIDNKTDLKELYKNISRKDFSWETILKVVYLEKLTINV